MKRFPLWGGMGVVISLLFVSAAFAQNDAAWRASVSEDLRGIYESLRRLNDRLDVIENNHTTLQRECARLSDELRSVRVNPSASAQDLDRLGAEVKRLDESLRQSNAARERERTALVEQVAKMIDEMQQRLPRTETRAQAGGELIRHTVRSGENLTVIARQYGVSVAELRAANRLTNDMLRVGQVLTIQRRE